MRLLVYGSLAIALPSIWYLRGSIRHFLQKGELRLPPSAARIAGKHEPRVRAKFAPVLEAAGLTWPPRNLVLIALKQEMRVEAWDESATPPVRIGEWEVLAGSPPGHKLTRGDSMVPEGLYPLTNLNPESLYHLSIRVGYPSAEDLANQGDRDLGDDIYVHGKDVSIGCLAMGDEPIEEIFTMAQRAKTRRIVIAPVDFRTGATAPDPRHDFVRERYSRIADELARFTSR